MEPLVWLAVAAVALLLLHVGVAAYIYRTVTAADGPIRSGSGKPSENAEGADEHFETAEQASEHSETADPPGTRTDATDTAETADRRPCPTCGVPNDPDYRFCRRCISDMTDRGGGEGPHDSTERLGS